MLLVALGFSVVAFSHTAAEISSLAVHLAYCHCVVGNRWGTPDISLK